MKNLLSLIFLTAFLTLGVKADNPLTGETPLHVSGPVGCYTSWTLDIQQTSGYQYYFYLPYDLETNYSWSFDGVPDITQANNEVYHDFGSPGLHTVSVTITDLGDVNPCSSHTITQSINVEYGCETSVYFYNENPYTAINPTLQYNIYGSTPDADDSYLFTLNDGRSFTGYDNNYTESIEKEIDFGATGTYEVCFSFTDKQTGCFAQTCDIVVAGTYCSAAFEAYPNESQYAFQPILTPSQTAEFAWSYGDGTTSEEIGYHSHIYHDPGTYTACLAIKDAQNACNETFCQDIHVSSGYCTADFDIQPLSKPGEFKFHNKSNGDLLTYSWSFGDGSTSVEKSPIYSYDHEGVYKVTLFLIESSGCYAEYSDYVRYGANVNLQKFNAIPSSASPTTVVFGTLNTPGKLYYWDFGDGTYGTGDVVTHNFPSENVYDVCLYVSPEVLTASNSSSVSKYCSKIQVGSTCDLKADFAYTVDKISNKLSLQSLSRGDIAHSEWYVAGTDVLETNTNSVVTPTLPKGKYWVQLAIANSDWTCWDFVSREITIGEADCHAEFIPSVVKDNTGNYVLSLRNVSKGAQSFYWSFGNPEDWEGNYAEVHTPSPYIYTQEGEYRISLFVDGTGPGGWCWDYAEQIVYVGQPDCEVDFTSVNLGDNKIQFIPETRGDITELDWYFGTGAYSSEPKPEVEFPNMGYYFVELVGTGRNGCVASEGKLVMAGNQGIDMEADFSYKVVGKKTDGSVDVRFADRSKGNYTNTIWYFGDATDESIVRDKKSPSHTYAISCYYDVCLLVYNDLTDIEDLTCKTIAVAVTETDCDASFVAKIDKADKKVTFKNTSVNSNSFKWYFSDGTESKEVSPTKTFGESRYYDVLLEASNGQCTSRYYALVNLSDSSVLYTRFKHMEEPTLLKASGYPVDFLGAAFGNPAKVSWDFGDGTKDSTSLNPTHYYASPGVYQVCMTAEDPNTGEKSEPSCQTVTVGGGNAVDETVIAGKALIYPNPVQDNLNIVYTLSRPGNVTISLYNTLGAQAAVIEKNSKPAGTYTTLWSTSGLTPGVYYLKVETNSESAVQQLIIAR